MPVGIPTINPMYASLLANVTQGDAVDPTQNQQPQGGPLSQADAARRGRYQAASSRQMFGGNAGGSPLTQHIQAAAATGGSPYVTQGNATADQMAHSDYSQPRPEPVQRLAPAAPSGNTLAAARAGQLAQPGQADANGEFGGARAGGAHDTEIIRGGQRSVYSTATGTEQAETPAQEPVAKTGKEPSWNTQNQQARFAYDHLDKQITAIQKVLDNPMASGPEVEAMRARLPQLIMQHDTWGQKLMGGQDQQPQAIDQSSIPHHAPSPGAPLPPDKAQDILQAAGGDKEKARQMAKAAGWGL